MKYKKNLVALCISGAVLFSGCGGGSGSTTSVDSLDDNSIESVIQKNIKKYDIPAMAVLVVDENDTVEMGVYGLRDVTKSTSVTTQDNWNIGSLTKSMSATLAAKMVEQGYLGWDTTLVDVFAELENTMLERYKSVTLKELLSHTAGLPVDSDELWAEFLDSEDAVTLQRYEFTSEILGYDSDGVVGEYAYSNINYVIVSAMLERLSALSYEELMQTFVFDPLGMNNTHFGNTDIENNALGHKFENNGWVPKKPSEISSDNIAIVAPAGSQTSISLEDMKKFLQEHLRAKMLKESSYLASDSFNMLHTKRVMADEDLGYSLGWYTEAEYGLQHSGSNGRWFALQFINSDTGYAYFIVINGYKVGAEVSVYEMMQTLIQRSAI
jgi:CubicO group peptidase (beta-lactamase class C family)